MKRGGYRNYYKNYEKWNKGINSLWKAEYGMKVLNDGRWWDEPRRKRERRNVVADQSVVDLLETLL